MVKSIELKNVTYNLEYDESDRLVLLEKFSNGNPNSSTAITYDEQGNLLKVYYEEGFYWLEYAFKKDPVNHKLFGFDYEYFGINEDKVYVEKRIVLWNTTQKIVEFYADGIISERITYDLKKVEIPGNK